MLIYVLVLCFLPALLVFGFVKIFKKQLAKDPTKKQIYKYVAVYLAGVIGISVLLFGLTSLIS